MLMTEAVVIAVAIVAVSMTAAMVLVKKLEKIMHRKIMEIALLNVNTNRSPTK